MWLVVTSQHSDITAYHVRSDSLLACHASIAFLHFRCLNELDKLPWRLCNGSISDNLVIFGDLDGCPPDACDTTTKIFKLLQAGYSREELCEAVSLLRQIPWSTTGIEQAHASAALVSKQHPQYGLGQVAQRGFIHSFRALIMTETPSATRRVLLRSMRRLCAGRR